MNINDWLKQNDSVRYEDKSIKESQRKVEQRRVVDMNVINKQYVIKNKAGED